jgi:hypothetical protein
VNIVWKGCAAENFAPGCGGMKRKGIDFHVMDGTLAGTDMRFNTARFRLSRRGSWGAAYRGSAET